MRSLDAVAYAPRMEQPKPTDWKRFFEEHAPHYHRNPFAQYTKEEVDFLLTLFPIDAASRILDVGCGIGRHAVEFARRGFAVTGIDFSPAMLAEAQKLAIAKKVEVEWIEADATTFVAAPPYDMAVCLCEGAFNLIGGEEEPVAHDLAILRNVAQSLKPGAPFVLNALNAFSFIRQVRDEAVEQRSFDPLTMVATYRDIWKLPEGEREMLVRERLFTPPEISAMLHTAGFEVMALYGGSAGEWSRRPLKLDEVEAMFVCRRK